MSSASEQQEMESLLGGYRILDLTDEKGLMCGKILGDLGADVIKVEKPGGDPVRNKGPFYNDIPDPEKSLFWFYTNSNKRGITLNIETADGKEIFKRLVKSSHFVIESFKPGYMDSLGLGYNMLEQLNPGIILTSITPFGQTGPYIDKDYKCSDMVLLALGGRMYLDGDDDRPPVRVGSRSPQAYFQGGLHGALGSMMAHYHRELTGEGQWVDVSIQEAVILTLMIATENWDVLNINVIRGGAVRTTRRPPPAGDLVTRSIRPCQDGYITGGVSGGGNPGMVYSSIEFVKWADQDGMAGDLVDYDWRKQDRRTVSQQEIDHIDEIVAKFLLTKTKREIMDEAVKRQMLLCSVSTAKDILECPQLAAREYFVQVDHPELGDTITYPGAFVKMSACPWVIQRRAPLIGEHNEEIFENELGFTKQELILLKSRGVI